MDFLLLLAVVIAGGSALVYMGVTQMKTYEKIRPSRRTLLTASEKSRVGIDTDSTPVEHRPRSHSFSELHSSAPSRSQRRVFTVQRIVES